MRRLFYLFAAMVFPLSLGAQQGNPVSSALRDNLERGKKNLTAAAEQMPEDKYSFRPTPPQMTFAHLVLHIAGSNNFLCSKIAGVPEPPKLQVTETDSKSKLVDALKSSFDFCSSSLAKVDDSNLGEPMTLFGERKATRAAAMLALSNDFADHYAAAAIYLRLNGILPPTAQPREKAPARPAEKK